MCDDGGRDIETIYKSIEICMDCIWFNISAYNKNNNNNSGQNEHRLTHRHSQVCRRFVEFLMIIILILIPR